MLRHAGCTLLVTWTRHSIKASILLVSMLAFHEVPMSSKELLLGFDRRVRQTSHTWDAKRRERFLLRIDVVQPFSTDTTVWPSALDSDLRPPTCIGHQTLWNDLVCLESSSRSSDPSSFWLIGVTLHLANNSSEEATRWRSEVPSTSPAVRAEAWSLLGYDISDKWLLSGLSNCGFLPGDDVQALRREWSSKLNHYHLFDRLENAMEFRARSDRRAVEHSPFFVFGIWSIASMPSA